MIGHSKYFDNNMTMSFKVSYEKLLKMYTKIWGKIISWMNKEFDSESVYGDNDRYIKIKINLYGDKLNTNFHSEKIPKKMHHTNDCHR